MVKKSENKQSAETDSWSQQTHTGTTDRKPKRLCCDTTQWKCRQQQSFPNSLDEFFRCFQSLWL